MDEILHEMHAWMHAYMRSYHTDDDDVMLGIRLKEIHTGYVTANARALAQHLGCTPHDTALAEIIGLFHDVGRFRQYAVYQTFNDAQSEDHAELGLKVIAEHDLLSELCAADTELVRFAIKYHNKKE
ncbi:MAG: HD domain-containing protein, partial [Selenomonas artemidis]